MNCWTKSLILIAALAVPAFAQEPLPPPPGPAPALAPAAGICVTIDPMRDTLTEGERNAARALVLQAFEAERLAVDATGTACAETYALANIKLGETINVTITGPRGTRQGRANKLDDLANVYSQMVKSLVTGAPMETGGGATDRTNVTKDQSAPRRVAADNLKYFQLGYGGVIAGRFAYGPAFAGGYRKELDRIGLDISASLLLANDTKLSDGITLSLLRLMLLVFQEPTKDGTMYYGVGPGYGLVGARDSDGTLYGGSGIQIHLVAGYEAFRSSTIRGFVQLEGTLPLYKSDTSGADGTRYMPQISLNVGIGYGKTNVIRVINE